MHIRKCRTIILILGDNVTSLCAKIEYWVFAKVWRCMLSKAATSYDERPPIAVYGQVFLETTLFLVPS